MNPKEFFHNNAYSVQLPYTAGHSLFPVLPCLFSIIPQVIWNINSKRKTRISPSVKEGCCELDMRNSEKFVLTRRNTLNKIT